MQGANLLNGFRKVGKFHKGTGALLPKAYKKFYQEMKAQPTAVHYIPKEGTWERNGLTGVTTPVQNVPIPIMYPPEYHQGIWGGEGVVKGFQKRNRTKKRVPHYWVPVLRRNVLHSVILNKYFSTIVTERTMDLVHESHGFDHYLLKVSDRHPGWSLQLDWDSFHSQTPACDLKSRLAFRIKREMLQALLDKCPDVTDTQKKTEILGEYSKYLEQVSKFSPINLNWFEGDAFNH